MWVWIVLGVIGFIIFTEILHRISKRMKGKGRS